MNCLLAGGMMLVLTSPGFSLHWTHSVEQVEWAEEWRILSDGLQLTQARVKGSGAGMEPGDGAELIGGWWVWSPGTVVKELRLAASGATGAGWRLCDGANCYELGAASGQAVVIAPCGE